MTFNFLESFELLSNMVLLLLSKVQLKGVNLAKLQSLKMYNFRSSVLIHLKYSPDITHRKVFKWVQFYGRRF